MSSENDKDEGSDSEANVVAFLDTFFGSDEQDDAPDERAEVDEELDDDSRKRSRSSSEAETSSSAPKRQRKPTATVVSALGSAGSSSASSSLISPAEPFGMQSNDVSSQMRAEGAIIMPPQIARDYHAVSERRAMNGFKRPDRTMISAHNPKTCAPEGRCKLCFFALSGALSVNKDSADECTNIDIDTQKSLGGANKSGDSKTAPNGWEYHNGIAILSAIWKMYKSAEMFAGKDELCAGIARQWNAYISPVLEERFGAKKRRRSERLRERDRSSSGNVTHLGEMLIEKIKSRAQERRRDSAIDMRRRKSKRRSVSSAIFGESDDEEDDQIDSRSSSSFESADDYRGSDISDYDDESDDEDDQVGSMMLSVDDVQWHFDNCAKTTADELENDVDMLNKIGKHLIENEMFIIAEDVVLDDDKETTPSTAVESAGAQRVVINDRALHMYLSLLNTKRQHADSMLRQKKEDGVPSAYTLLAMRREIDGDSKDNGIGVRNMQRMEVKGKLTGI